jgi:cardiolipin synthase
VENSKPAFRNSLGASEPLKEQMPPSQIRDPGETGAPERRRVISQPDIVEMSQVTQRPLNRIRSAPNLLTLARICLAPFLVAAILEGHYALSFVLFVAAGLTDALDGLLARWLKQHSVLGQYLDPVADKLLLSTLFLVLLYKGQIPVTVTVLVFGRDLGILLVAAILYAAVGRREFKPSVFGKANTLAQIAAVAAVLLRQLTAAHWVAIFRSLALDATIVLTVISGLHYAWVVSRRAGATAGNGISNR